MGRVVYLKAQCRVRLQLLLSVLLNLVLSEAPLHLQEWWVVEEDCWRPARDHPIQQGDDVVGWSSQECFLQ